MQSSDITKSLGTCLKITENSHFSWTEYILRESPTCFPFEGDIHSTCQNRGNFSPKKIKTGFRPENLLCFARFAITQFVRLDGRVLHAIFCYIIEGLKEKDENSHVQGTAKHLCFYELWETQFYKNFYYWMFCLIKSNKTVQKWLAPQAHNAMRFSISHKNCPASELP